MQRIIELDQLIAQETLLQTIGRLHTCIQGLLATYISYLIGHQDLDIVWEATKTW